MVRHSREHGANGRRWHGMAQKTDIRAQIADEIYIVLARLGADAELLDIVGSWGDALTDADVLRMLHAYNSSPSSERQK
jgi:hypothetical protein